jgi:hypothetical protein
VTDRPTPPVSADADLQDFPFMPLHVARLRDSDLAAEEEPEACWYAVLLWAASWHQLPAGSLPDNDTVLMRLVGLGRDKKTWQRNKEGAMRGFVLCSDGRFYHPVVAEQVNEAWDGKIRQRHRTFCAAVRKHNERNPKNKLESPSFEDWDGLGRPERVTDVVTQMSRVTEEDVTRDKPSRHGDVTRETASKRKGQGQGQGQGDSNNKGSVGTDVPTGADAPDGPDDDQPGPDEPPVTDPPAPTARDLTKAVFDTGLAILRHAVPTEQQARRLLGKWRQQFGDGVVLAVLSRCEVEGPTDPVSWMTASLQAEQRKVSGNGSANLTGSAGTARRGQPDGTTSALHRQLAEARSREASEAAGRRDAGGAGSDGELPLAPARALPRG